MASKSVSSRATPACIMATNVAADGVHLGVEFAAQHAVAQVDQARAGIFSAPRRVRSFSDFKNDDSRGLFDRLCRARCQIEIARVSLLRSCKKISRVTPALSHQRRHFFPSRSRRFRHALHADRVPYFERPQLPAQIPSAWRDPHPRCYRRFPESRRAAYRHVSLRLWPIEIDSPCRRLCLPAPAPAATQTVRACLRSPYRLRSSRISLSGAGGIPSSASRE